MLNWISYKYGFGTYLHRIEGYYSKSTYEQAREELTKLINSFEKVENHVFVDTLISPSYTSAIAQAIQLPGISGMENNMVLFEYDRSKPEELNEIIENFALVNAGHFDICIVSSTARKINYRNGIHVWIKSTDEFNSNLMILLSFVISGHPDWKRSEIKIFDICKKDELEEMIQLKRKFIEEGRLPITEKNIEIIIEDTSVSPKQMINERSVDAALTLIGFREESLKHGGSAVFDGYDKMGTVLFVNSHSEKVID